MSLWFSEVEFECADKVTKDMCLNIEGECGQETEKCLEEQCTRDKCLANNCQKLPSPMCWDDKITKDYCNGVLNSTLTQSRFVLYNGKNYLRLTQTNYKVKHL